MERTYLDHVLAVLAMLAIVTVAALIVSLVATGVGQDFFQSARSVDEMVNKVMGAPNNAMGLRLNIGFDNLFIVLYATYFTVLASRFASTLDARILTVALGSILLTALLDAAENHHFTMMIHSMQHGLPVTVAESQIQMIASNVKFHASYLALALFSIGFLREGGLARAVAWLLWLYIAVELVSRVMPVEYGRTLALVRTVFFVASFLISGIYFGRNASRRA